MDLIEVTSQPLVTAALHILEPRKPFPPQTTILFDVAMPVNLLDFVIELLLWAKLSTYTIG